MSSDSISPKAFYSKRSFGYSRWTSIPENPFENAIILYDSMRYFERPQSDLEDHALLIKISVEEQEVKALNNGSFYCDHTIYLSPTTTSFLFFKEKDKITTLSMSDSSLESKVIKLYNRQILSINRPNDVYSSLETNKEPCLLNVTELDKDWHTNKMKGLLYGYYIGALLSANKKDVKQLNTLKEIHNIFAAILSSFNRTPTIQQNEQLENLFDLRQPKYQELALLLNNEQLFNTIVNWDKKYNTPQNSNKDYYLSLLYSEIKEETENPAISWIKNEIEKQQSKMKVSANPLDVFSEEIVIVDNRLEKCCFTNDELGKKLLFAWVNDNFSRKEVDGKINTFRDEFAKQITLKAKEIIGEEDWEKHPVRKYLNELRHHIAGDAFNQKWQDGLLSSISAVILKGENWENLLSFMQSKELTNYKMAFAFYGILNGYANLTRDFTDILYDYSDKGYVWNVYKEFYGQLHHISLPELKKENIQFVEKHPEIETSSVNNSDKQTKEIPECLQPVFNSDAFKKMKSEAQDWYREKTLDLWPKFGQNTEVLISKLKKLQSDPMAKGKKGWGKWKDCIKSLEATKPRKRSAQSQQQGTLFDPKQEYPIGEYFYNDNNVWIHIEPIVVPDSRKEKVKKEIEWIQEVHQKGGYFLKDGTFTECKEIDNESVIKHFYYNNKNKIEEPLLTDVCKKLKELYHVK
ncbi:MAG: hypothetical protein MJZ72_00745 [Bacteroidales bacterium]|nr:hypothetical protein [Bacteroidales bacterium]